MPSNTLIFGDWNAICDQCGRKAKASQMIKRWDGFMVHADPSFGCFEYRNPQDFVRAKIDDMSVPWTRPEATDVFIRTADQDINCSTQEFSPIDSPITADVTVAKRYHNGDLIINTGIIVTVLCNLEIR